MPVKSLRAAKCSHTMELPENVESLKTNFGLNIGPKQVKLYLIKLFRSETDIIIQAYLLGVDLPICIQIVLEAIFRIFISIRPHLDSLAEKSSTREGPKVGLRLH